jgi:hypothetical protein
VILLVSEEFVITSVEKFLAYRHKMPLKPSWSRYALSQYLKKLGYLGSQKATIAQWERDFCYYIKDFRNQIPKEVPKDADGKPLTIYPLTPYQASVIIRLAYALTQLRPYLNGQRYTYVIQAIVKNREIQRKYFSYQVFVYDQNTAA